MPGSRMNGIRDENFVFTFSAYIIPFLLKVIPRRGFIIFKIFFLFFSEFSKSVEYEWNSELKFCFPFFGLSHPVLAKNNPGKRFYNLFNFFTIFFGIFMLGSSMNRIRDQNFVFIFSADHIPFYPKNIARKRFYNLLNFLLFFSEFSLPGRV